MRLGFRKANNGSRRGRNWNPKTSNTPSTTASSSGTGAFWPPLWPADEASGLGGIGPGGRGYSRGAERSGRGEVFAARFGENGKDLAVGGEVEGVEPREGAKPGIVRAWVLGRGAAVWARFFTRAWRGRAGGVRAGVPRSAGAAVEIGTSAPVLWGTRGAALAVASAAALLASAIAWLTRFVALAGASLGGACAVASADETISSTCVDRSVGTASPAARAEPTCRPAAARAATAIAQPFTNVLQRGPRSAWVLRFLPESSNRPPLFVQFLMPAVPGRCEGVPPSTRRATRALLRAARRQ